MSNTCSCCTENVRHVFRCLGIANHLITRWAQRYDAKEVPISFFFKSYVTAEPGRDLVARRLATWSNYCPCKRNLYSSAPGLVTPKRRRRRRRQERIARLFDLFCSWAKESGIFFVSISYELRNKRTSCQGRQGFLSWVRKRERERERKRNYRRDALDQLYVDASSIIERDTGRPCACLLFLFPPENSCFCFKIMYKVFRCCRRYSTKLKLLSAVHA